MTDQITERQTVVTVSKEDLQIKNNLYLFHCKELQLF